jgi:hypothetical protein
VQVAPGCSAVSAVQQMRLLAELLNKQTKSDRQTDIQDIQTQLFQFTLRDVIRILCLLAVQRTSQLHPISFYCAVSSVVLGRPVSGQHANYMPSENEPRYLH